MFTQDAPQDSSKDVFTRCSARFFERCLHKMLRKILRKMFAQDPLEEIYAKRSCEASFAESIYSSLI